jgi:tetratricopeptide (TPR) repeat protein
VGNISRAREFATHARARHLSDNDRRLLAHVAETEAQIHLADGDHAAAQALTDEAIEHAKATDNHRAHVSALLTRARLTVALSDPAGAIVWYEAASDLIRSRGARARLSECLGEWADVLAALGRHDEAYALAREALHAVDAGGNFRLSDRAAVPTLRAGS